MSWLVHFPAILVLIATGFIAGPITGFKKPDQLFGKLFNPIISLSVAIILFEGGLNLRFAELKKIGRPLQGLLTIGPIVTLLLSTGLAYLLIHLDISLCFLFGAILTVTGPTVIIPLLSTQNLK